MTDTPTIDTSPGALRALADTLVEYFAHTVIIKSAATLRALADEKEREAGRRADVTDARERFWYEAGVWRTNYVGTDEAHDDALRAVAERALDALIAAVRADRDTPADEKERGATSDTGSATPAENDPSSSCPICGVATPHRHVATDVRAWAEAQVGRFGYTFASLRDAVVDPLTFVTDECTLSSGLKVQRTASGVFVRDSACAISGEFLSDGLLGAISRWAKTPGDVELLVAVHSYPLADLQRDALAAQLATARADVMTEVRTALGFADSAGAFTPADIAAYVAHQLTVAGEDAQAVRAQLATAERRLAMATRFDTERLGARILLQRLNSPHQEMWFLHTDPPDTTVVHPTLDAAFTAAEAYLAAQVGEVGR